MIKSLSGTAVLFSKTSTTLGLVISGNPDWTGASFAIHSATTQNTGTYAKPSAQMRVSDSEFAALVAAFPNQQTSLSANLTYEDTLTKNNVRSFTCPGIAITFPPQAGAPRGLSTEESSQDGLLM